MAEFSKYIGLDVHKETIAVAVADGEGGEVRYLGEIANQPTAVKRLLNKLTGAGERLRFCYEAGPCGYDLYRQIIAAGHTCVVVAPALIPRKPGDRIKTDRRDAMSLARLDRAGELTTVWVPGPEQEAMRDLSRAREDMKIVDRQLRQRLSGFMGAATRANRRGRRLTGAGSRANVLIRRSSRSCSKSMPRRCVRRSIARPCLNNSCIGPSKAGAWERRRRR